MIIPRGEKWAVNSPRGTGFGEVQDQPHHVLAGLFRGLARMTGKALADGLRSLAGSTGPRRELSYGRGGRARQPLPKITRAL